MKLHYPKKGRLNYKESLAKWESTEVPYQPFFCVEEANFPQNGVKLLIGYTDDGGGIFITNNPISIVNEKDKVEAYKVSSQGINSYYKRVKRPSDESSIFRKPKVGDTLLCVAECRYMGCEFGETYIVEDVGPDERISFNSINTFTYEAKYFVVVDSVETSNEPHLIFESDLDAMRYGAMTVNPCKEISSFENDKLIVRKRFEDEEPERREIYTPELIVRN